MPQLEGERKREREEKGERREIGHLQILPDNERLYRAHLQAHQRVSHARHILARVLADLVEKFADEPLLLNKLHVRQGVCRQLNGLIKPILATCIASAIASLMIIIQNLEALLQHDLSSECLITSFDAVSHPVMRPSAVMMRRATLTGGGAMQTECEDYMHGRAAIVTGWPTRPNVQLSERRVL